MKVSREYILQTVKQTLHLVAPNAKIILFGLRARNDAQEDSDWDLLILIEKDKILNDDFDKIAYPLIELGWELDEYIHPIFYTFKDWKKRCFTPFYKNIEKEGIVL